MTTIDEAASLRTEDERDAQDRGTHREEFGAVPDVPLAGDEWDEDDGKNEPDGSEGYDPKPSPTGCQEVDEATCSQCKGHNRCEDEMDAGHGDYGRDDPREVR